MSNHPTTIAGKTFTIADRYAEGQALSANEASALNQLRRENIRNNLASQIKDLVESGAFDETQAQATVDTYASSYEFGVRTGGGGGRGDPIQTMAMGIARDTIKNQIVKKGKKLSEYTAKQITAAAEKLIAKDPRILATARKRVAELEKANTDIDLDDLIDSTEAPAEAASIEPDAASGEAPALVADPAA